VDDKTRQEFEALRKLEKHAETGSSFSEDEIAMIKEALRTYQGFRSFGYGARMIIVTLGMVAAFVAAWETVIGKLRAWVAG